MTLELFLNVHFYSNSKQYHIYLWIDYGSTDRNYTGAWQMSFSVVCFNGFIAFLVATFSFIGKGYCLKRTKCINAKWSNNPIVLTLYQRYGSGRRHVRIKQRRKIFFPIACRQGYFSEVLEKKSKFYICNINVRGWSAQKDLHRKCVCANLVSFCIITHMNFKSVRFPYPVLSIRLSWLIAFEDIFMPY